MSKMDEKRGLKALETWAKRVTSAYNDVKITDMSSSWRSGLGFCAIIHHYRPDLIDYDLLSKENILHNNSLAFSVAEKQLGVPALLDAEDMEKFTHLDRLSIITYLSQLYNFFENQNKLNKTKPPVKRILSEGKSGPPSKISTSELNVSTGRKHDVCQTCKHRVYILERLIVSGKLYHRTCFKCCRCNTILKPGAYVEGETEGTYECATCPQDETSETDSSLSSVDITESVPTSDISHTSLVKDSTPAIPKLSLLTSSVDMARNSFLKRSVSQLSNSDSAESCEHSILPDKKHVSSDVSSVKTLSETADQPRTTSISVRDRISAFECNGSVGSSGPIVKLESDKGINRDSTSLESSNLSVHSASDNESPTSTHKPYQSVLLRDRSPRPLTRLKLDIATRPLSESKRRFSSETLSSPLLPGVKSSESAKSFNLNYMPVIKSPTYSLTTLPRQSSLSSFSSKEVPSPLHLSSKEKMNSEESLNSIIHDRWSRMQRRGSLESEKKNSSSIDNRFSSTAKHLSSNSETDSMSKLQTTHKSAENLQNSLHVPSSSSSESSVLKLNKSPESAKGSSSSLDHSSSSTDKHSSLTNERETAGKLQPILKSGENIQNYPNVLSSNSSKSNDFKLNNLSLPKLKTDSYTVCDESISPQKNTQHSFQQKGSFLSNRTSVLSQYKISLVNKEKHLNVISDESSPTVESKIGIKSDDTADVQYNSSENSEARGAEIKEINRVLDEQNESNVVQNVTLSSNIQSTNNSKKLEEKEKILNSEISLSKIADDTKEYPDDLNPFGDDDALCVSHLDVYPDDLNPFGDSDEESCERRVKNDSIYDESMNPFASDDDEETISHSQSSLSAISRITPVPALRTSLISSTSGTKSPIKQYSTPTDSPTGSLSGTLKKRQAPKPPSVTEIFKNESVDSSNSALFLSTPSPSRQIVKSPSPKLLKSKPAPPPPPSPSVLPKIASSNKASSSDDLANSKQMKDIDNFRLKSSDSVLSSPQTTESREWKKKKRPAPPVPIPRRREIKKIPLREILTEMTEIELKQEELEKQGRDLEVQIRDKDKDEEPTVEEEELIMQLFELVNQKNALFRRQAELMYIKRSQKLEEEQADLEYQIRCLMQKPVSQKSESDVAREDRLVQRLLDVVDQRNEIIDSIEMDRKREAVEDSSVQEQMDVKNTEIKEKGLHKNKAKHKDKKKKKKTKNQEESKSGTEDKSKKSSSHKIKWF